MNFENNLQQVPQISHGQESLDKIYTKQFIIDDDLYLMEFEKMKENPEELEVRFSIAVLDPESNESKFKFDEVTNKGIRTALRVVKHVAQEAYQYAKDNEMKCIKFSGQDTSTQENMILPQAQDLYMFYTSHRDEFINMVSDKTWLEHDSYFVKVNREGTVLSTWPKDKPKEVHHGKGGKKEVDKYFYELFSYEPMLTSFTQQIEVPVPKSNEIPRSKPKEKYALQRTLLYLRIAKQMGITDEMVEINEEEEVRIKLKN